MSKENTDFVESNKRLEAEIYRLGGETNVLRCGNDNFSESNKKKLKDDINEMEEDLKIVRADKYKNEKNFNQLQAEVDRAREEVKKKRDENMEFDENN